MLILTMKYSLVRSIVFISMLLLSTTCAAMSAVSGKVVSEIGNYYSPDKSFKARIAVDSMGGFKICEIMGDGKVIHRIDDINALVWVDNSQILYSGSPIYGKPGIFIFDCKEMKEKIIIRPQNINSAYPNGADYFELAEYSIAKKVISYYYSFDVDLVDFRTFRNENNIRKQELR